MIKRLITNLIEKLKGRSAHQIKRSELDSFIDDFEANRTTQPQSRTEEIQKSKEVASLRDKKA